MTIFTKKRLLTYLAGATISASAGGVEALQNSVDDVPLELLGDVLDDATADTWESEDRLQLLSALVSVDREEIHRRVLDLFASEGTRIPWDSLEDTLGELVDHGSPKVCEAVGRTIATALKEAGGITRTQAVTNWALSESPMRRIAIMNAVTKDFYCLGVDAAVSYLSEDPNPEVRIAAAQTAARRISENPADYQGVLEKLSSDPDFNVRQAARHWVMSLDQ